MTIQGFPRILLSKGGKLFFPDIVIGSFDELLQCKCMMWLIGDCHLLRGVRQSVMHLVDNLVAR